MNKLSGECMGGGMRYAYDIQLENMKGLDNFGNY
jgi:hypothetical protein